MVLISEKSLSSQGKGGKVLVTYISSFDDKYGEFKTYSGKLSLGYAI